MNPGFRACVRAGLSSVWAVFNIFAQQHQDCISVISEITECAHNRCGDVIYLHVLQHACSATCRRLRNVRVSSYMRFSHLTALASHIDPRGHVPLFLPSLSIIIEKRASLICIQGRVSFYICSLEVFGWTQCAIRFL